ncbi:winged helix-turn-helix domain-containing protein [Halorubellus litoreus]|uniref:ArsR/SmtB family transcription factor n=1 Tax=Halorubellus litoreus TaxID=755308 RepID=A0ABD5VLW2_9EURY
MASDHPPFPDATPDQSAPPVDVLTLLAADHTQKILGHIHDSPTPARAVVEVCDASRTTVYRRLNRLVDAGLVDTRMTLDPDGHHRTVFETTIDEITLDLTDDGYALDVHTDCSNVDSPSTPHPQPSD